jgi:hypothetical protein
VRRSPDFSQAQYYLLTCAVLTGLLASVVVVRADILHFVYLAPVWYVELAWILGSRAKSQLLKASRPYLVAYVGISFGMLSLSLLLNTTGAHNRIETRRGTIVTGSTDTVINYVQSHIAAGEEMLVYPYLPLYNYLTATRSPSRYDYFQTGMNTSDQSNEIISSMDSRQLRAVLFEPTFSEKIRDSWPGTKQNAFAYDPVASYIARNYRVCKVLHSPEDWRFQYMVQKDKICP